MMMDYEKIINKERKFFILDGMFIGLTLALSLIFLWLGFEIWIPMIFFILTGYRLGQMLLRSRVIEWMEIAHRTDATVEMLVNHLEGYPSSKSDKMDYV